MGYTDLGYKYCHSAPLCAADKGLAVQHGASAHALFLSRQDAGGMRATL
jgi:hypothetical protein